MRQIKTKNAGITLVGLVVTIIVLLILAGITINLTIGEGGIIKRTQEAGKNYIEAAEKERNQLAEFLNHTDNIIANVNSGGNSTGNVPEIPKFGTTIRTENSVNYISDGEGNEIPVPEGFKALEGTRDTGFVIQDITTNADGTPKDTNGNEFVWVPCTLDGANGSIKYDRYSFGSFSNSGFSETMPSDEESCIGTYGGFYIGRYETGIADSTSLNTSTTNTQYEYTGYTGGKAVIKPNQQVWNYITRDKAKKVSEDLYKKSNGYSVNSKLCSSYAWDTALKFIENKYPTYPTDSTQGNYSDKSSTLGKPAKTGQTTAVNNIYDMGGNTWEWTTETSDRYPGTDRGGEFNNSSSSYPAAIRNSANGFDAAGHISFRTTLYL